MQWTHLSGPLNEGLEPLRRSCRNFQAGYIARLLHLFSREGLFGTFVCMYAERDYPADGKPGCDLDLARLGIMKAAYERIAEAYKRYKN